MWINNQMTKDVYDHWQLDLSQKSTSLTEQIEKMSGIEAGILVLLQEELDNITDLQSVYNIATTAEKQELVKIVFHNSLYCQDAQYRNPTTAKTSEVTG